MVNKLVLHIGMHKTGSTAIQFFANLNRERLHHRGILYPLAGQPEADNIPGHHRFAWAALGKDTLAVFDELREEINKDKSEISIISSEVLDTLSPDQVNLFLGNLPFDDITLVCYLRRQDQFVQAMYSTDVMWHDYQDDISEYLSNSMETTLDYYDLLNRWAGVLGKERMIIKPYVREKLKNQDIIDDFFSEVNLDVTGNWSRPLPQVNNGFPRAVTELVCKFRQAGVSMEEVNIFRDLVTLLYTQSNAYDIMPPSARREMLNKYSEINSLIAREFLTPSTQQLFEDPTYETEEEWKTHYMRPYADILDLMLKIHNHLIAKR